MRKIERHPSNEGSVITFDMYGKEVQLFVADAKYRAIKKWSNINTSFSSRNYYENEISSLSNFTDDCKFITPDKLITDNPTQQLSYSLQDFQLQGRFPSFAVDKTAKENTDILMQYKYTEAAHWCRSQNISGVGELDLPNIYELIVIYLESDRIDALDPTVNEYNQYALGMLNPNGRFHINFAISGGCSSTKATYNTSRNISLTGYVGCYSNTCGECVIPVKELFYNGSTQIKTSVQPFKPNINANKARTVERHPSNEGSVITFDMYGKEVQLFVADAKYRTNSAWSSSKSTYGIDYFTMKNFADDDKRLNPNKPDNYERDTDDDNQPLSYYLTDYQLQERFPSFKNDKTAKENTDILMINKYTDAAHWCRSQNIAGIGELDLPNIYEVMVIYLEADRIDDLDPTVNDYKQYALGMLNPKGRFAFSYITNIWSLKLRRLHIVDACWSSTKMDSNYARVLHNSHSRFINCDKVGSALWNENNGVIPVKEL